MNVQAIAMILAAGTLAFLAGFLANLHYKKSRDARRIRTITVGNRSISYEDDQPWWLFWARAAMFAGFWVWPQVGSIAVAYYFLVPQQLPCAQAEQRKADQIEHGADKTGIPRVPRNFQSANDGRVLDARLQRVIAPFADAHEESAQAHQRDGRIRNLQGQSERSDERSAAKPSDGLVPVVELQLLHHIHARSPRLASDLPERNA